MQNRRYGTFIIVRRTLTEPNAAFAGVILEISFARFRASMAIFNDESVASRRFRRWGFALSMVKSRGRCEEGVWRGGCGRPFCHGTPVQTGPSDEESSRVRKFGLCDRLFTWFLCFATNALCAPTLPLAISTRKPNRPTAATGSFNLSSFHNPLRRLM